MVAESLLTTALMTPTGMFCDYASSRYQTRMPASAVPSAPAIIIIGYVPVHSWVNTNATKSPNEDSFGRLVENVLCVVAFIDEVGAPMHSFCGAEILCFFQWTIFP